MIQGLQKTSFYKLKVRTSVSLVEDMSFSQNHLLRLKKNIRHWLQTLKLAAMGSWDPQLSSVVSVSLLYCTATTTLKPLPENLLRSSDAGEEDDQEHGQKVATGTGGRLLYPVWKKKRRNE
eukprot:snap_masked-scaffold_32-processed-gene-3.4-mRNA-1 protein AED:1.00 eAED:1.00 QI:0/0/0/0/1/1/2/0/120